MNISHCTLGTGWKGAVKIRRMISERAIEDSQGAKMPYGC